jgi:hypothetical protein
MFGRSYIPRGEFVSVLLQRTSMLILMLALSLGSAPVQAAPDSDKTTYEFRIQTSDLPDPICPNSKHNVEVTVSVDRFFTKAGGTNVKLDGGPSLSDITFEASVSDSSVAEVVPEKSSLSALDHVIASKSTIFTLVATKAGSTTLRLTGSGIWAGESVQFPPLELQIKVTETCKYRASMIWQWRVESQGTVSLATGWLETVLTLQDGVYKGEGFLDTVEARFMPGCSTHHSGFQSPTEITGVLEDSLDSPGKEEMQLTIRYQPGPYSFSGTCSGQHFQTEGSENPTDFLVGSTKLPKEGGSKAFPFEYGHGHGTMTIRIFPVDFSY